MNGWELTLIAPPEFELDASAMSAIESCTNEKETCGISLRSSRPGYELLVGDLFKVRYRADDRIVMTGDVKFMHQLGFAWSRRTLLIEGDVGLGLGTQMQGGSIQVLGQVMDFAGCQMRGGVIRISGDAGNFLGGPRPGRRSGMSGGRVVVTGNVGHHPGHCMRRGTIVMLGDCGDGMATDMVAGTIVAGGNVGELVGAGMRRGTVVLARASEIDPVCFTSPRDVSLSISRILANDLVLDAPEIAKVLNGPVRRWLGDRSVGGLGEILATLR